MHNRHRVGSGLDTASVLSDVDTFSCNDDNVSADSQKMVETPVTRTITSNRGVHFKTVTSDETNATTVDNSARLEIECIDDSCLNTDEDTLERRKGRSGILEAASIVCRTKTITGSEFNALGTLLFIVNVVVNAGIYWSCYAISINNTEYAKPASEKKFAICTYIVGLAWLILQICCTVGYCLRKREHPLVRSRGVEFMATVLVTAVSCGLLSCINGLHEIRVVEINSTVLSVIVCIRLIAIVVLVGAQLARQRLIYVLFVKSVFSRTETRNVYRFTYAAVFVWAVVINIPLVVLNAIDPNKYVTYTDVCILVGTQVMLFGLLYYTWLSRMVTQAFSDWRTNLQVGVVIAAASLLTFILRHTVWNVTYSPNGPTSVSGSMLRGVLTYFAVSVVVVQMFGMIAIVVYFNIETGIDLNPNCMFASGRHMPPNFGPDGKSIGGHRKS
eukprot:CFRG7216T1